jgi:hypothetical protein
MQPLALRVPGWHVRLSNPGRTKWNLNMQHNSKSHTTGQIVLMAVAISLVVSILAVTGVAMFGSKDQFDRAKDLLPILISVLTPLLTAATALYLAKR